MIAMPFGPQGDGRHVGPFFAVSPYRVTRHSAEGCLITVAQLTRFVSLPVQVTDEIWQGKAKTLGLDGFALLVSRGNCRSAIVTTIDARIQVPQVYIILQHGIHHSLLLCRPSLCVWPVSRPRPSWRTAWVPLRSLFTTPSRSDTHPSSDLSGSRQ
jgi:hypothetical protein